MTSMLGQQCGLDGVACARIDAASRVTSKCPPRQVVQQTATLVGTVPLTHSVSRATEAKLLKAPRLLLLNETT